MLFSRPVSVAISLVTVWISNLRICCFSLELYHLSISLYLFHSMFYSSMFRIFCLQIIFIWIFMIFLSPSSQFHLQSALSWHCRHLICAPVVSAGICILSCKAVFLLWCAIVFHCAEGSVPEKNGNIYWHLPWRGEGVSSTINFFFLL